MHPAQRLSVGLRGLWSLLAAATSTVAASVAATTVAATLAVTALIATPTGVLAHPVSPLPSFVRPAEPPLHALPPPEQASTGAYWLLYDAQQDIPTRREFQHNVLKVLSEAGLSEASQISVDYEPSYEKLHWHRITLWRNGQALELLPRLKPTEMRREEEWDWGLLDGRITQLFSLEDVRNGQPVVPLRDAHRASQLPPAAPARSPPDPAGPGRRAGTRLLP
jgi:hypothetical protein